MPIHLVVLDYDGTLTDIRGGSPEYDRLFVRALADFIGAADLREEWERTKAELRRGSPDAAWTVVGPAAVAPAAADPYTLASQAGKQVLARHTSLSPALRSHACSEIHSLAYAAAPFAFRPEAPVVLGVLRKLAATVRTCFVTNSATTLVESRLTSRLFPDGLGSLEVRGNAAKFLIGEPKRPDARFSSLPESRTVAGLARPILLRRGAYYDVLESLWSDERAPATPETTLVVGDVWELDLAMPAALGANVQLITRDSTYDYEREQAHAHGGEKAVSETLMPVLERLGL